MTEKFPVFERALLLKLYRRLYRAYGPQYWWPAHTRFEVMAGAVLTQNTAWRNVERALANLKRAGLMNARGIDAMDTDRLAGLIRPSGYFNVKARRLKKLCGWLLERGGLRQLDRVQTPALRDGLLAVNGIGPETADDILLYAFDRPVFVIDAYTRRLLRGLGLARGSEDYETLRKGFEQALGPDPALYNEYHALIVRHAKEPCVESARCRHCRVERSLA